MYAALPQRSLALTILEPTILLSMTALCLVGNILVCLAVYRTPSLRTSSNVYVITLAVSDLLNAVVMSLIVGVLISGRWPYGEALCNVHAFFTLLSVYVSPATMGLAAFNRYVRVVKSSLYPRVFTPVRSKIFVGAIWLFVAGYVLIPRLAGWTSYSFISSYAVCTVVHNTEAMKIAHYCIVVSLFLVLPFGVSAISYYKVFKTIKQHNLRMASTIQSAEQEGGCISVREIKITRSLAIVVLAFGLCWIPFWIIAVIQRFTSNYFVPRNAQLLCTFLSILSSTINPFIYAGTNPTFKAAFHRILLCKTNERVCPTRNRGVVEAKMMGVSNEYQNRVLRNEGSKDTESQYV